MLIAPALVVAQAVAMPAPAFAPVAERPYRLVMVQRRIVRGVPRRFTAERRVVFRREGAGWVADMLLVDVATDLPGDAGARFIAAAGALRGRTVRVRFARDGALVGIDDEAAVAAAAAAGMTSIGSTAMAPPFDRATLAEPLSLMIAAADAHRAAGHRPVKLPSLIPGTPPLAGDETVAATGGKLRITVSARGAAGPGSVAIDRERLIDPATGLVERRAEHRITTVGDQQLTTDSETTLTLAVP